MNETTIGNYSVALCRFLGKAVLFVAAMPFFLLFAAIWFLVIEPASYLFSAFGNEVDDAQRRRKKRTDVKSQADHQF